MYKNYVSFKPKKRLIYAVTAVTVPLKSMAKRKLLFILKSVNEWLSCKDIYARLAVIFGRKQGLSVCIH